MADVVTPAQWVERARQRERVPMGKRNALKEMFDAVEAGHSFTVKAGNQPVAMVIPWDAWTEINRRLSELGWETGVLPEPITPTAEVEKKDIV